MDAVKYFEEKKRMLDSLGRTKGGCYGVACSNCLLCSESNGIEVNCGELEMSYPERAIEIIEKWSEEHPRKTLLQDFLEKYPKARLRDNGTPKDVCPYSLGYEEHKGCCDGRCMKCWNRPLEE